MNDDQRSKNDMDDKEGEPVLNSDQQEEQKEEHSTHVRTNDLPTSDDNHHQQQQERQVIENSNLFELTSPLLNASHDSQESNDDTVITADLRATFHSILAIYSDQSGSFENVTKGLCVMALVGIFCGLVMPKNPDLITPWYRTLSSIIGYIYFVSWSVSFYPQLITNYEKKSMDGLSTDASILAFLNYTCYTIYNAFFFWNEGIRQEYKDRHGADAKVTVQSNDVAFSMHALLMNIILISQITYYGGYKSRPISWITIGIVGCVLAMSVGYIVCIYLYGWLWIDFLYLMATVKLVLTILTYLPQVLLNYQRKSTSGWNLWNVIFDCTGGVLSMLQLVLDSVDLGDFQNGLLGNIPKLILGFITLSFDATFFFQHSFYQDSRGHGEGENGDDDEQYEGNYSLLLGGENDRATSSGDLNRVDDGIENQNGTEFV